MKDWLSRNILYLFLLPVFFVLHAYTENYDLVPVLPALKLLGIYLLVSAGLYLLFYLFYHNHRKAALLTFFILSFNFFFGTIQDTLNDLAVGSFFTKYSFILPVSLACFIVLLVLIKRTRRQLNRTTLYLNSLLLLLLVMDTCWLLSKIISSQNHEVIPPVTWLPCKDCPTPDVYFIIADGYPGNKQSREILNYDNIHFEEELKKRGFHVTDSSLANYNFTFFSMASMLNMNYLQDISGSILDKKNIPSASKAMNQNQVLDFFRKQGYQFFNLSIFNLHGKKTLTRPTFWIHDTRPITRQTFLYRLNRDMGYHLVTTFKIKPANAFPLEQDLWNNELLYTKTREVIHDRTSPKFVYTHLMLPHHPYYFDSLGNKRAVTDLTPHHGFNKAAATSYIVYSNKKYLLLIDEILSGSSTPPMIILASDHGFREIKEDKDKKTMFLNLNAVFFPTKDYSRFYKGMSNVNLFRVILNTAFGQQLPMLKDSTVYLND